MRILSAILILMVAFSCTKPLANSSKGLKKMRYQDGEHFISINGIKHWVKIKGSINHTTPIIILHGGPGGNHYNFENTIGPRLEKFATLIYYEQRGCGRSAAPDNPEDYLVKTLISDLEILRDSLELEKINLLGYSFGAELALRYAHFYPNRVEKIIASAPAELSDANKLVQIHGFYSIGDSIFKAKIHNILKDTISLDKKYNNIWVLSSSGLVDKFLFVNLETAVMNRKLWQESKLKNTGLMAKTYLKNNKSDLIPSVSGLKTPTLLISGAYDKNGGFHTGLLLKQVLPNSTLKIYENSAHFPDMEEPERFANDVKAFIGK